MLPAQPNQSLIDGLAVLQAVIGAAEPVGVRELARRVDLEPTRANRLLKTLAHLGMVEQTAQRKYRAGPSIHVLSAQSLVGSGLIRRALGPLRGLHALGMTVAMGVLWRDQVSYLYHTMPEIPPEQGLGRMGLFPASRSSIGQALLAARPEAEVRRLYEGQAEVPGFPGGIGPLLAELARVRKRGFASVRQPAGGRGELSHYSLALPLGDPPYAAIALAGRFPARDRPRLIRTLRETGRRIESDEGAEAGRPARP